jgi:alkylhydroperoxidase/carboxymuconolactone decarboxylase family protein YurZ
MELLIWSGALVSLLGVAGLGWCVAMALRLRKSGLGDEEMRSALQQVVAYNMGALAVSALGLMMVVLGIILR